MRSSIANNQASFRLAYELLQEAGKETQWKSYDHDRLGFVFMQRNAEGRYAPGPLQRQIVGDALDFFDRHLMANTSAAR